MPFAAVGLLFDAQLPPVALLQLRQLLDLEREILTRVHEGLRCEHCGLQLAQRHGLHPDRFAVYRFIAFFAFVFVEGHRADLVQTRFVQPEALFLQHFAVAVRAAVHFLTGHVVDAHDDVLRARRKDAHRNLAVQDDLQRILFGILSAFNLRERDLRDLLFLLRLRHGEPVVVLIRGIPVVAEAGIIHADAVLARLQVRRRQIQGIALRRVLHGIEAILSPVPVPDAEVIFVRVLRQFRNRDGQQIAPLDSLRNLQHRHAGPAEHLNVHLHHVGDAAPVAQLLPADLPALILLPLFVRDFLIACAGEVHTVLAVDVLPELCDAALRVEIPYQIPIPSVELDQRLCAFRRDAEAQILPDDGVHFRVAVCLGVAVLNFKAHVLV